MNVTQLASRYAKSVYEIAVENKSQDKVLADLRAMDIAFPKDPEAADFLASPLIHVEDRTRAVDLAVKGNGVAPEVHQLLLLLVRNGRIRIFKYIVEAFEAAIDEANGVSRGTVRSAYVLGPADRQQIETIVEKVLKKKVILTYKVDPTVIGGLVAQVGSYTFDDSLDSHLHRMNEELKRRAL